MEIPEYYNNEHGSLYKIAEERGWNAYQFDIVKRIDRATKKGEFIKDLEKTKTVIDLWIKETAEKELLDGVKDTEVFTDFITIPERVDITTLSAGDRFLINGKAHKMIYIEDSNARIVCHVLNEKSNKTLELFFHKGEVFVYKLISDKESTEH